MTPKIAAIFGKDHAQIKKCYGVLCASKRMRGAVVCLLLAFSTGVKLSSGGFSFDTFGWFLLCSIRLLNARRHRAGARIKRTIMRTLIGAVAAILLLSTAAFAGQT
jgi:hypothetical protein